jgi:hypothetical protein
MNLKIYHVWMLCATLTLGTIAPSAMSQPAPSPGQQDESTVSGTVVSSTVNRVVVRTEGRVYHVFVFDRFTVKPPAVAVGSTVRVTSTPSSEAGVRVATNVTVTAPPSTATPAQPEDPVPVSVRRIERDIERQARRYAVAVHTGVGVDPEILLVGVGARLGTTLHRDAAFTPNLEFGFGEVTKMFALNLEGSFRLPITPSHGRWSTYAGLGPSFVFFHQNFERAAMGDESIDFGEFDFEAGLNIFTGVAYRSGAFFEMKTTVWAIPTLRFILGYRF